MEFEKWFQRVEVKFKEIHGEQSISQDFLQFMQSELKAHLMAGLNLDPSKMGGKIMLVSVTRPFTPSKTENVIHLLLGIHHYGIEISFFWKSREGYQSVLPGDTDFDPARLISRTEGIDPEQIRAHLGIDPALQAYFQGIETRYDLQVEQFTSDLVYLVIEGRPGSQLEKVGEALDTLVTGWNLSRQSRADGGTGGVFHSSGVDRIEPNTLYYKIDLGTTDENGLKSILQELNHHQIDTVRITSFP